MFTVIAIFLVIGSLTFLSRFVPLKFVQLLSEEVLQELPRTVYLFAASVTGTCIAIAIYVANHPTSSQKPAAEYFLVAALFSLTFFTMGCGLKALLLANPISSESNETREPNVG